MPMAPNERPARQRRGSRVTGLSARVVEQYRQPFDELLAGPETRAGLDEFDVTLASIQLVGPIVLPA